MARKKYPDNHRNSRQWKWFNRLDDIINQCKKRNDHSRSTREFKHIMSENIIIEEDTKTEVHEMILDMPEGEKGIEEENTTETQNVTKNTLLAQMDSKLDLILAYQEATLEG